MMSQNDSSETIRTPNESATDPGDTVDGAEIDIRFLARFIDLIVHYGITAIVGLLEGIVMVSVGVELGGTTPIDYVTASLGSIAYHSLCEGMHGATLGKLICGLRIVRETGTRCGMLAACKRSLAIVIDSLFLGAPAIISMRKTSRRQRLGDRWAKTVVVKRHDLEATIRPRSALRFAVVFLGGVMLDGAIFGFDELLELIG